MNHIPQPARAFGRPHVVILGASASRATFPEGDASGRRLPLMADLIETVRLKNLLAPHQDEQTKGDFELLYHRLVRSGKHAKLVADVERRIYNYFADLEITGPATVYDRLVLSLRKQDVIATFNWDPLLFQACLRNHQMVDLPEILYLHGNVAIGFCERDRQTGQVGSICSLCDKPFDPLPLLYPITEKDYGSNEYIQYSWKRIQKQLGGAYLLTIFGYRAPQSDSRAIDLLRSAWKNNAVSQFAQLEIVDILPESQLEQSWQPFFVRDHYGITDQIDLTWLFQNARRSCETFCAATMQNDPWPRRPMPSAETLDDLHEWVQPLVEAERLGHDLVAPEPPVFNTSA